MSQINYANATFNKVVLEGSDFKDKEAVTASYVTSKIDDLVNGALPPSTHSKSCLWRYQTVRMSQLRLRPKSQV